jgi:hypothetical protein
VLPASGRPPHGGPRPESDVEVGATAGLMSIRVNARIESLQTKSNAWSLPIH